MVISDFSNPQSSIRNPHSFERATPTSFGKKLRRGKPGSTLPQGFSKAGREPATKQPFPLMERVTRLELATFSLGS